MSDEYEYISKIDDGMRGLKSIITSLENKIIELEKRLNKQDLIQYDTNGFKFCKRVIYYISQGIEENKAVFLAADDFKNDMSYATAQMIWKHARASKNGLILYGRYYTAKKMRLAGYSIADISIVLGLSIPTVRKLLETPRIID